MKVDLFELMLSQYRHYGVQVIPFWDIYQQISEIDCGLRRKMAVNFDYTPMAARLEQYTEPCTYYLYEDDLKMNYSFFRFSQEKAEEYHCRLLSIGPFLFHPFSRQSFQDLMENKGITADHYPDYLEFFNGVPLISSFDAWNHMLGFFLSRLEDVPLEFRYIRSRDDTLALFSPAYADYSIPQQPDMALENIEARYQLENEMMNAVASGNTEKALQIQYEFQLHRLLPRVADPVRDRKNLLFTFNTLLRKAAEAGHVHPLHIDNLSCQFAIQIESLLTEEQLDSLSFSMIRKYCMLVKNYSRKTYSPLTQRCLDYVDFHYNKSLSLSDLAELCSVSDSYLSNLFKKETGMTVTDYINSTRIHQSLILLNSSSLSIGEIAYRCGFDDANYFSRIFKKFQGQTPKQYRDKIRGR